jgi:uncharacterized protein (TIGR02452 family)
MGRTEKSQGLAPPAVRKDIRAKHARNIINKVVPAILSSNAKARRGSETSELLTDPGPATVHTSPSSKPGSSTGGDDPTYVKRKGQGRRKAKNAGQDPESADEKNQTSKMMKGKQGPGSLEGLMADLALTTTQQPARGERSVRIVTTDALTAARLLQDAKPTRKTSNVCILSMGSPLRPGGGVLTGATSQEEFLCARTTLLASLKDSYYRLPEFGGIWTSDVLVFRNALPLGDAKGELDVGERYFVDVISAGMLRFPELEGDDAEVKTLSRSDRDVVEKKMRAVLRIAAQRGVKKMVLGAWGCGAYGNPVADISAAWGKVLDCSTSSNNKKSRSSAETWPDLEEVIFAIPNRKMATDFSLAFGGTIHVEPGPGDMSDEEEEQEEDTVAQELRTKITEMESQLGKVWNPDLKTRMGAILDGLRSQLAERGDTGTRSAESEDEEDLSTPGNDPVTPESTDVENDGTFSEDKSDLEASTDGGIRLKT